MCAFAHFYVPFFCRELLSLVSIFTLSTHTHTHTRSQSSPLFCLFPICSFPFYYTVSLFLCVFSSFLLLIWSWWWILLLLLSLLVCVAAYWLPFLLSLCVSFSLYFYLCVHLSQKKRDCSRNVAIHVSKYYGAKIG